MRIALLVTCLAAQLSGCTLLAPHEPPASDWPPLLVIEKRSDFFAVQKQCGGNIFWQVFACVDIDFCELTCTIHHFGMMVNHEKAHCRGEEHDRSGLAELWETYKTNGGPAICEARKSAQRIKVY